MSRIQKGAILASLYLLSIILAAAAVEYIGPVGVGFGLIAPAGAYFIGVNMVLRDLTQDQLGPRWTFGAMVAGTALSALLSPSLAIAAAAGFLIAETLDLLVYTPLRRKTLVGAVVASNVVGAIVDSFVFLTIAFGSLEFFTGQVWAKLVSTFFVVAVLMFIYRGRANHTPAYLLARHPAKGKHRQGNTEPLLAGKE